MSECGIFKRKVRWAHKHFIVGLLILFCHEHMVVDMKAGKGVINVDLDRHFYGNDASMKAGSYWLDVWLSRQVNHSNENINEIKTGNKALTGLNIC